MFNDGAIICYGLLHWVISSMVLDAGVGVNNQNWALTSTLIYHRFKYPIELKLELTFWLLTPTLASNTILEITQCSSGLVLKSELSIQTVDQTENKERPLRNHFISTANFSKDLHIEWTEQNLHVVVKCDLKSMSINAQEF